MTYAIESQGNAQADVLHEEFYDLDNMSWYFKHSTTENAIEWFHNVEIQFSVSLIFFTGLVMTVTFSNTASVSAGLLCGGFVSIICCIAVVCTYLRIPSWRKHPNPIIYMRSLCDLLFATLITTAHVYSCARNGCILPLYSKLCSLVAVFTQFSLWASECWYLMMVMDMKSSFQNPFTDYKRNMRLYHIFVWVTAFTAAIVLWSVPEWAGYSEFGYCWTRGYVRLPRKGTRLHSTTHGFWNVSLQSWLLFYTWILIVWVYAVITLYAAWKRLHSGLSETLGMRFRVLQSVTVSVVVITLYWIIIILTFIPFLALSHPPNILVELLRYLLTCKGYFNLLIWLQMNSFKKKAESSCTVHIDMDLNPQMNLALRRQIIYFTTNGIIQSVKDTTRLPPTATQQEMYLQPPQIEDSQECLRVNEIVGCNRVGRDRGTLFIDYCPHTFRELRYHYGILDEEYTLSLRKTTKEKLSEGASGAFMFFSYDQQLIVKSLRSEESIFLRSILSEYTAYLLSNPASLLVRIYGCHAIRLYGNTYHFVVMANLFSSENAIHQRYDIKGSYVNRSAKCPTLGQSVTCRYCKAKFKYHTSLDCPTQIGRHEPNVVYKDNDLIEPIRLNSSAAKELYGQLVKDAEFLYQLGIMDYSLLLGVFNQMYTIRKGKRRIGNGGGRMLRADAVVGPAVYYFGIIDILQQWTLEKRLERFLKVNFLRKDAEGISAMPPKEYFERFKRRLQEVLGVDEVC